MILLFQIVCLCITLFVLQKYITSGAYSRTHRLLPLLLGLIGVYNFYEVIQTLTGEYELFASMKELLIIQVLYLLLFYVLDFLKIRFPEIVGHFIFVALLLMDIVVFLRYEEPETYQRFFWGFVGTFLVIIVVIATYAYIRYSFTEREKYVANRFYLMLLGLTGAFAAEKLWDIPGNMAMLGMLACVCICIHSLVQTHRLMDTGYILRENLFDNSNVAMVLFDADYYYLNANRAARNFFRKELGGLKEEKRISRPFMNEIREMTKDIERKREIERDGRYYQCQLTPTYYEGRLRGYVMSLWDITSQKKETQLMSDLRGRAETKTALKSDFLARMSHDLRSPLYAIIGISDILSQKQELSARNRSLVKHIRSAGDALLEQVDAILDYSRLESGRLELANTRYRFFQVLEDLAHMCVINLQSKSVKFTLEVKEEFPCEFMGDPMRVREIIQNLLMNAVKFTESGEIRCELRCKREEGSYNTCIICQVTDTGAGMTREQLDAVFGEYVTFAGENNQNGTGLGLCIVKQLSELMGGSVTAESNGISGTTITVSFYQRMIGEQMHAPVRYTGEDVMRQADSPAQAPRPTWIYPKARVLLADDMEINHEIFKELAAPWEFTVDTAYNGKEAVAAVQKREYQIIFLDQVMPEMTGDAAAEIIRGLCDAPLILMTADFRGDVQAAGRQYAFADFLGKPIDMGTFQRVIEGYMPKAYRRERSARSQQWSLSASLNSMQAYKRTLETFVQEVAPLARTLPGYVPDELLFFRAKVHGIKGACRQIGRYPVSEQAEIMEMAAKTENIPFLDSHMEDFIQALCEAIEDVEQELRQLPPSGNETEKSPKDVKELFAELKAGFDSYELGKIEESIRGLADAKLTREEALLLAKARAACKELDYEKGSSLFL